MNANRIRTHPASRRTLAVVLAGLTVTGTLGVVAAQPGAATPAPRTAVTQSTSDAALLAFNREEERMARDLYEALAEHYGGAAPFSMITRSEQVHWTAVGTLLATHDVTDPSAGLPAGTYADPAIQTLYDGWLERGLTSLDEAYQVGVELEKRDIADLDTAIARTTLADARQVLSRLRTASERHLAAFQAAASGQARVPGAAQRAAHGMGGAAGITKVRTSGCPNR